MENSNTNNNDNNNTTPSLCIAGCGFFGNEAFNNMCSQCYKAKNKDTLPVINKRKLSNDDTAIVQKSKKHVKCPSPDLVINSAPTSSMASPASTPIADTNTTPSTPNSEKPLQSNKARCFKCRLKVPLAKQAANKCRCGYVFCDSHRYPDRHDCDIDYAKMDREILAKNNPKLHERPKGGRSFQRIDSL